MSIPAGLDLAAAVGSAVMFGIELRRVRAGRVTTQRWLTFYGALTIVFLLFWFFRP